jgi:hypothetical protein
MTKRLLKSKQIIKSNIVYKIHLNKGYNKGIQKIRSLTEIRLTVKIQLITPIFFNLLSKIQHIRIN